MSHMITSHQATSTIYILATTNYHFLPTELKFHISTIILYHLYDYTLIFDPIGIVHKYL